MTCATNCLACINGRACPRVQNSMRAVLVYARDQLDHLAKFHGYDMTLLRKTIATVLGDPPPEVGSTFSVVLKIAEDT